MENHSSPTISKIFDCNDINGNGDHTSSILPTDQIGSGLGAAPTATGETTSMIQDYHL